MFSMTDLLKNAINQIDNLNDYFVNQYDYVLKRVNKNKDKYKYGILLDKFFYNQMNPETTVDFSSEEESIVKELLADYNIKEDENNSDTIQVSYKLNESFDKEGFETDPIKAREALISLFQQPDFLSESVLMMLLIKYEDSISRLYRYVIEKHPQAFLSKKSITYSDLLSMKSDIEEIKKRFVDDEIDAIMREPIDDWYSSFNSKQKATFLFEDNLFDDFKEIYYRRNLVVHNQGIVNDIYLSYVKNTKAEKGQKLFVDRKYLDRAFSLTSLMLVDTFFGLRKIADDKNELVEWIINSYGFKCLQEKKWEMAKYLYKVVLQDESILSADLIVAKINYMIAIKNIDGVDAIRDEVNNLDVSALKLTFVAAKSALLNEYEQVSDILDKCLEKNEIDSPSIKTWPLFNEFRESDEYIQFVERHKEEFDFGEYTAPTDDEASILKDAEQGHSGIIAN